MNTTTDLADKEDLGFLDIREIARLESGVTPQTIRNRIAAGQFPPPDAVKNGASVWLRSTYAAYQKAVLRGEYRGRPKVDNFRGRSVAA